MFNSRSRAATRVSSGGCYCPQGGRDQERRPEPPFEGISLLKAVVLVISVFAHPQMGC